MNASGVEGDVVIDNLYDAVEAVEAKLGVDGSAVTTSHDYKLSGVTATGKAASLTGTETLTNKRLTAPKLNENVAITSTATELNFNDGSVAGAAVASKALVLGDAKGIDGLGFVNLDNNKSITMDDNTNTARQALITDGSNNLQLGDGANFNEVLVKTMANVRAYLNTEQSNITDNTDTLIVYDTESWDLGSDFNISTGLFTAPVTGYYIVNAKARLDELINSDYSISIYIAGAAVRTNYLFSSVVRRQPIFVNDQVYMTAGQTLGIYIKITVSNPGPNTGDIESGTLLTYLEISYKSS
jgi:hypothetical protein